MRHIGNAVLLCAAVAMCLRAQVLTTLASFNGKDGAWPANALVQATDGNFYGTTNFAGAHRTGTIFRMNPHGQLTTLYNFCFASQLRGRFQRKCAIGARKRWGSVRDNCVWRLPKLICLR